MRQSSVYRRIDIIDRLKEGMDEAFTTLKKSTRGREKFIEPKPRLIKCDGEQHWSGPSNVTMMSGPDRPGSCGSGYGGRGDTHASSFRIIVGHMGAKAASVNKEGEPLAGHPSNAYDAATFYMSQKTDVDSDFGLVAGRSVPLADKRSAVALKADGIRIIAREGIKLVTGVDEINSQNSEINSRGYGIDLIAKNDKRGLQPLVRGHNLERALTILVEHMEDLGGVVDAFITSQMVLNTFMGMHHHIAPLAGPTTMDLGVLAIGVPSINLDLVLRCKTGVFFQKINSQMYKVKYLTAAGKDSWICSFNNNTN